MPDLLVFQDAPLTGLLPPDLTQRLRDAGRPVRYADGRLIHARGDDKPGFSLVRSGAVRLVKPRADGGELTLAVIGPGFGIGEATLFAGAPRAYDAYAAGDTVIDQISKRAFDRILDDDPRLARAMLSSLTRRLYSALSFLDDVRSLPLIVRAAKLIAGMNASAGTPGQIVCRQSDLAFTLGVSRVSIGKALTELQNHGLIRLCYGVIGVPNPGALNAWIRRRAE
jgi:CRP/FNR family cyclic AMP-dependent transcriptional regulator